MRPRQLSIAVIFALLAGCDSMPSLPVIGAYHIDIQQGNVVTQDMVSKLKPGMTRSQVRFVLGTPLISDVFHSDRWDYVYRYEKAGKLVENRRIVAVFNGDKLARIEGDVVPASATPEASSSSKPAPVAAPATTSAAPATPAPAEKPAPPAPGEPGATPEKK